jgi:insertion element IS1 protein InsB
VRSFINNWYYRCQNPECEKTFIRDYSYNAHLPEVKEQISDMAMNGSGIRDTAWVLAISPNTMIETLKKAPGLQVVNESVLKALQPTQTIVRLCLADDPPVEAEVDEM